MSCLRPRARLEDVLRGRADLVGARLGSGKPGLISPVEARLRLGLPYGDLAADEARYLSERTTRDDVGVLARAALSLLIPLRADSHQRRLRILSTVVDSVSIEEALEALTARSTRSRATMVHFAHPHAVTLAHRNDALRRRFAAADLVLPDGVGLQVAASLLGRSLTANVNGTDLLPLLCARAVDRDLPLALVGGAPGVAAQCAAQLRGAHDGLEVPAIAHGFLDDAGARAFAAHVSRLGPCIVLVGLGTPIQEAFAWRHLSHLRDATVVTVGGLFDFYSGRVRRAPQAWREVGLEWLFRLLVEPRRLARRYLVGIPLFLALTLLQRRSQCPEDAAVN